MQEIQFGSLPALAKIGIGAGILFVWVLFEREVIERFGIYHYMPLYRVEGIMCLGHSRHHCHLRVLHLYEQAPREQKGLNSETPAPAIKAGVVLSECGLSVCSPHSA